MATEMLQRQISCSQAQAAQVKAQAAQVRQYRACARGTGTVKGAQPQNLEQTAAWQPKSVVSCYAECSAASCCRPGQARPVKCLFRLLYNCCLLSLWSQAGCAEASAPDSDRLLSCCGCGSDSSESSWHSSGCCCSQASSELLHVC